MLLAVLMPLAIAAESVTYAPPLSDEVLFNPHMGLYLQYPPLDAQADEWFMKICDIAYYRLDWGEVNPEPGVYTFDDYFGPRFDFWVGQHHKRVAFRVMCQSMHSRRTYVTPKWVFDQGVPGVVHIGLNGQEQIDPVFWDDRYLEVHSEFVRALGKYLDGRPGLEFVDIGSIGEWGEMHLARWTPQQLAETGFSETRYVQAYRRIIDVFREAFPRTPIFLNVGGQKHLSINDYAALRGMHFRQDGLTPTGASYDCGAWLYPPYSRRGVICNFEFHSGWDEMHRRNWDVPTTIERGLAAPISYLNTNLFGGAGYRQAPEEARRLLTDAARRIGYRFVLTSVEHPAQVSVVPDRPSRIVLSTTWRNDGVAPCYDSFATEWSLVDRQGVAVATERIFPATPTTHWWQGEPVTERVLLRLPAGASPGEYRLAVKMILPETGQTIGLGIAGRDAEGRYLLDTIVLAPGEAGETVIYDEGFEGDGPAWSAVDGVEVSLDEGAAHEGRRSLLVSGTAATVWNYASVKLPAPLLPNARYRLSGWMMVEANDPALKRPYLKVGVHDRDGRWLSNAGTDPYNTDRLGTWQWLEGYVEVPPDGAMGYIAIEKGDNVTPVTIRLRLDDLRVELVEGG